MTPAKRVGRPPAVVPAELERELVAAVESVTACERVLEESQQRLVDVLRRAIDEGGVRAVGRVLGIPPARVARIARGD